MKDYDKEIERRTARPHVRRMSRCPECLNPRLLAWFFKWDKGAITLRMINRNFRFVFLESDMLNEVIDLLVEQFGADEVYKIARDTEMSSAEGYVAMLFFAERWWAIPISYLVRHSPLMAWIMELNCTLLGYAAADMLEITGNRAGVLARNPYNIILFQADLEGSYAVMEGKEGDVTVDTVSKDNNIYIFYGVTTTGRIGGILKKYKTESPPIVPVANPDVFGVCPKCGIPEKIARFWWDTRSGTITHKDTGKRVILWPCYALEKLTEAFVEALGEQAQTLIFDKVRKYQRDTIASGGIGFNPDEKLQFIEADKKGQYQLLLRHLACMGFGSGEVDLEQGNKVRVTLTNALIPAVTSGLVAGMIEALEGRPVKASWEVGPETTLYVLEF